MAGILDNVDQRTKLAGQNRLELLLFSLGGQERYGINVFKVHEVIRTPESLSRVPGAHPAVKGLATIRGNAVTIIDLRMAIGHEPLEDASGRFVIVTEYNRQTLGFMVPAVEHIANLSWEEVEAAPTRQGESYVTAVAHIKEELVEIIDVERILQEIIGVSEEITEAIDETGLSTGQPKLVMVVDDSTVARNQVKRVLDQLGVDSILCDDGKQALEQLKSWVDEGIDPGQKLSMAISDIEMPRMDGYTLTTEIRNDPALASLYIVLHSSLSGMFNQAMVQTVGADRFLPKYDPNELAKTITERIGQQVLAQDSES
ncbi:chemotaxis protein CheV [Solemya velesiana gill symbiont]|uniref:Chemotaxis protein CheW n=1 Tax=Solemya velesiana gill symbiont TaxID=1918948 RepID=A0A1T2KXX9_9GAMM|nr:chemotaxis protein CheV [Solemya velesiana gill symbiont]OOZ37709.1 chemotaxis protein CheW [Solemya velesiana gill symbiont]